LAGGWLACSATQERREALLFNDKSTPLGIRKPIFREWLCQGFFSWPCALSGLKFPCLSHEVFGVRCGRSLKVLKFWYSQQYSLHTDCCSSVILNLPKLKYFAGSIERVVLSSTRQSYRGALGTWKRVPEMSSVLGKESPKHRWKK
jgi:hypothetical protein